MKANWELCKNVPKPGVQFLALLVSLSPKGELRMNRTAWQKLGEPKAVHVNFDPTNNRFGLKPCHESASHAFKLRLAGRFGARRLSVLSAMIERQIDITQTVQFFDAEVNEDGFLILDLRSARVPNRVEHHRARRLPRQESDR
jgi:hypothetical protein